MFAPEGLSYNMLGYMCVLQINTLQTLGGAKQPNQLK